MASSAAWLVTWNFAWVTEPSSVLLPSRIGTRWKAPVRSASMPWSGSTWPSTGARHSPRLSSEPPPTPTAMIWEALLPRMQASTSGAPAQPKSSTNSTPWPSALASVSGASRNGKRSSHSPPLSIAAPAKRPAESGDCRRRETSVAPPDSPKIITLPGSPPKAAMFFFTHSSAATVFKGVQNRMVSGYLLRDVINKLAAIHFTSTDELHTLGALYESMLREMRDDAGDAGEFYTPRPVVRFMVAVTDPRLGEHILDPASGTGGFLVESFSHLSGQVRTVDGRKVLQERSLSGCEPKPLPYLLCQMNLLLHGLDAPQIDPANALRFKLTEIGEKDRVDVILTNPPFGGEEEKGIQSNFPEDRQTAETALLFLQLIMRKLRKQPRKGFPPARAAVVVPNGTLFGDGVCARIKKELLEEFSLHTIVRLPNGVFAPYTAIPTNLLFFDRSGPTKEVWYYEHPLPGGRKNYTKTQPLQYEEFAPCLGWWKDRRETERAWKVPAAELLANGCNLDRKNPRAKDDITHLPADVLVASILEKERRIVEIVEKIQGLLRSAP